MNILKTNKKLTKDEAILELRKYITFCMEETVRISYSNDSFTNPSWPYKQAMDMGKLNAYKKLLDYLPK